MNARWFEVRILCIEDQIQKRGHIIEALIENGINEQDIDCDSNYQEALMQLHTDDYDIVLLDISLPIAISSYRKDTFNSFAGIAVLREIKRKGIPVKVIIISGFKDFNRGGNRIKLEELVNEEIIPEFEKYFCGYIHYDSTSIEWQKSLSNLLKDINQERKTDENTNC